MRSVRVRPILAAALGLALVAGTGLARPPLAVAAGGPAETVIATYRARIPELMREQGVPGLAVALVDADGPLWVEGFGHLDDEGSPPVTGDTIFSVQSMSKTFTATAVMQAVAAGRLDLDERITTYLPEFTVNSAFEDHPERRITLRMLLSHTAGFTHEAPIGNNFELDPGDFEAHVRSISETWLRFPVGSGHAYSNLGIDLAAYILEVVEGRPFADVVGDTLLEPLGMDRSTFDRAAIRLEADRAIGHVSMYPQPPVDMPMTGAGGLYASAADLARFLRVQLGGGTIDGQAVIEPAALEEMHRIVAPSVEARSGWALGTWRTCWNRWPQRPDLLNHNGGGFGFLSDLWWLPELGIGIAILTNSQDHALQSDLALSILGDLVAEPGPYRDRLEALPARPSVVDPDLSFGPPAGYGQLISEVAMPADPDQSERWAVYAGTYRAHAWGAMLVTIEPARFLVEDGFAVFETPETGEPVRHRLTEVEPGLFIADNGEVLDARGPSPIWRNIELVAVSGGPAAWQWAVLGAAAVAAALWLLVAAVRTARWLRSRRVAASDVPPGIRRRRLVTNTLAVLTAFLTLGAVAVVAVLPGLVDAGFLGWLDLPMAERLAFHVPLALAVVGAATVVFVLGGWVLGWGSRANRPWDAALVVAVSVVVAQLAGWGLIGWGLG